MDFNDIKNVWKNSFEDEGHLNKEEIEAKLKIKSKSNTALNKVKRNYLFELIGGGSIFLYFMLWLNINLTNYKIIIILSCLLFFGLLISFSWRNYNRIRKTVISQDQLKPALKQTIRDIERYVNFNKSSFTKFILLPFAIIFGLGLGLFIGAGEKEISEILSLLENNEITKMIIVFVVGLGITIPLSQYLNKKMYKQHLDELKKCLNDFEEIEE
jgi:hypothetical protein